MKCPCGCGKEVPHLHFFATKYCWKNARKQGIHMPANGEWREATRMMKKLNSLKKGKNNENH